MARFNTIVDSDDEFPDLATILEKNGVSTQRQPSQPLSPTRDAGPLQNTVAPSDPKKWKTEILPGYSNGTEKQAPFKIAHADPLLLPLTNRESLSPGKRFQTRSNIRSSPRKVVGSPAKRENFLAPFSDSSDFEDVLSDHMSDFIVPDSDSDASHKDSGRQSPVLFPRCKTQKNTFSKVVSPRRARNCCSNENVSSPPKASGITNRKQPIETKHLGELDMNVGAARTYHEDSFGEHVSILKLSG
ncbi:MAG: hypothetical protein Q9225_005450 [Loekoesia sp. 1 TL-2023]